MRARHRHFNPGHGGANTAFDSRFLHLANDALVDSWENRADKVGWTASGSARPTYKENVNYGLPMVYSSGSPRELTGDSATYITTSGDFTVIAVTARTTTSGMTFLSLKSSGGGAFLCYVDNSQNKWAWRSTAWKSFSLASQNTFNIESLANGSAFRNGASLTTGSFTHGGSANVNRLFGEGSGFSFYIGYIGSVSSFNFSISQAYKKRIEHAAAFSFKIACS